MAKREPRRIGAEISPLSGELLADPLAFLSAEHARQSVLIGHLARLAREPGRRGARAVAAALITWLDQELPRHFDDEEMSLHPRLSPFDTEGILTRLRADPARDAALSARLCTGLGAIADGAAPGADFLSLADDFAAALRQHLACEEEEALPLARRVLAPATLAAIAAEMAARRGCVAAEKAARGGCAPAP